MTLDREVDKVNNNLFIFKKMIYLMISFVANPDTWSFLVDTSDRQVFFKCGSFVQVGCGGF